MRRDFFLPPGLVAGSSVNVGRSLPGRFSDVVTLRAGGELNLDKSIIYTGSAVFGTQANEAGVRVHDGSAAASGEDSAACAADVTKIGETAGLLSEKSSAGPLVTKDAAGIVTFVAAAGDESSTKYFRVAASDLASATAVQFVVRGGDTAVVDVANDLDGGVVFTNVTHNIHYDAHAVYNFKGFSAVTFTGAADLRATIVAPSALVVLKNTVVTGAVFAKNLNAENSEVLRREVVPDCKCRGGVVTQAKLTGKANFAGLNAAAKKAAAKEVAPVARARFLSRTRSCFLLLVRGRARRDLRRF
jgi:choice-of-anchor A domain-containing protein